MSRKGKKFYQDFVENMGLEVTTVGKEVFIKLDRDEYSGKYVSFSSGRDFVHCLRDLCVVPNYYEACSALTNADFFLCRENLRKDLATLYKWCDYRRSEHLPEKEVKVRYSYKDLMDLVRNKTHMQVETYTVPSGNLNHNKRVYALVDRNGKTLAHDLALNDLREIYEHGIENVVFDGAKFF